jgi:hypothetical protein
MGKIGSLAVLIVAMFFGRNASATLTSSYHDGFTYYTTDEGLHGRIDFAVYDDRDEYKSVTGWDAPGTGDYVYAYQIFHNAGNNPPLAYFALLDIGGAPVDAIDSQDDQAGGIEPSDQYLETSEGKGIWEFENDQGNGILLAGDNSWFLVLSSEASYRMGEYEIKPAESWVPVPDVPEPGTLALLCVGGATLFVKRRKSGPKDGGC